VEPRSINMVEIGDIYLCHRYISCPSCSETDHVAFGWVYAIARGGRGGARVWLQQDEASDFEVGGEGRQRRCGEEG
jgi:hypothetical protein